MFTDFDHPWLRPLAFIIFLLIWHVLGSRVLQGSSRIPSPGLHDVIDILAAHLCCCFLWYPSPLIWFLVFTFLKRHITLSRLSISQQRPQSEPTTEINEPVDTLTSQFPPKPTISLQRSQSEPAIKIKQSVHTFTSQIPPKPTISQQRRSDPTTEIDQPVDTLTSQFPLKDSNRLLKDLLRSPIVLPSFPGMQSIYQPSTRPITLRRNSGTIPIFRPTTGNDGRASTTTRFDKGKQPMGTPLHTVSNSKGLPILTQNYQGSQSVNSNSKTSLLGKRKPTDLNSPRMSTLLMPGARDIIPPVDSGKRRKLDGFAHITSTSAIGKE
ncbi:hypothetical protein HBI56_225940 [Parastagonospora nodorum]|uniref:Uncharacterized protein n=2 Tax=Phaeosphaeria nodorum (strain SN15 / ATCC MYA-4574 / FGSC 10173) TaxID=321614 RepID=Q0TVW0_PHANO|nr:hypothetical protein SNOG_16278 [Parastagonospora nodorum SN15]KAH3904116.1 hypothetical protein HBH56_239560 [Parastagonospora nodorum]EAT76264.1 hypothetical protein SNOG_16278 [Parastagonospora nodorum SN15]KAH3921605.1 hypothetical protein HBH54_236500 [Parastagonospora nodorum]KAH3939743.1 hypothetical protein HBH53_228420 [Parastagonospora nodorum]KAH3957903.1 hypothetical protein HBH51_216960 [Parastagonospora nodorum]